MFSIHKVVYRDDLDHNMAGQWLPKALPRPKIIRDDPVVERSRTPPYTDPEDMSMSNAASSSTRVPASLTLDPWVSGLSRTIFSMCYLSNRAVNRRRRVPFGRYHPEWVSRSHRVYPSLRGWPIPQPVRPLSKVSTRTRGYRRGSQRWPSRSCQLDRQRQVTADQEACTCPLFATSSPHQKRRRGGHS